MNPATPDDSADTAGVIALPPLIYALPLAAGLIVQHFRPTRVLPGPWPHLVGPLLVGLGVLMFPAVLAFRRVGTSPEPWRPTTALVITSLYRWTRNPMYLGMTLLYLGITLWVNSLWPLLLLPAVLAVMIRGVIMREEAYLTRRFGDSYRDYRARVRRWI